MRSRTRSRLGLTLAACLAAHLALVALLARDHPVLKSQPIGPAVFDVTVVPMIVPNLTPPKSRARVRTHKPRTPAEEPPLPLRIPEIRPPAPSPLGPPPHLTPELGQTLRRALGCANIASASLSQSERDACMARLGEGARQAPYLGQGLSRDKQEALERAGATREAWRKYREAPVPPGLSTSDAPGGITGLGAGPPTPKHPF